MSKYIPEIRRHLILAKKAHKQILEAKSGEGLRLAWETFLGQFGKTISRLIQAGIKNSKTRAWAHKLKMASTKDDAGLVYMREARNVAEHGLKPFANFEEPSVQIGRSAVLISGNNRGITIGKVIENGKTIVADPITFSTSNGKITEFSGRRSKYVREVPAQVKLGRLHNEDNNKITPVPGELGGCPVKADSPADLAGLAIRVLDTFVREYENHF